MVMARGRCCSANPRAIRRCSVSGQAELAVTAALEDGEVPKSDACELARVRAERGLFVYGGECASPELVDDLSKRLAYAGAKIEALANPRLRKPHGTAMAVPRDPLSRSSYATRAVTRSLAHESAAESGSFADMRGR
jgi:hypothetical protein